MPRQALAPHGIATLPNLAEMTSVILAVVDELMIQWIAGPSTTPNSESIVDAMAAIDAIATS